LFFVGQTRENTLCATFLSVSFSSATNCCVIERVQPFSIIKPNELRLYITFIFKLMAFREKGKKFWHFIPVSIFLNLMLKHLL